MVNTRDLCCFSVFGVVRSSYTFNVAIIITLFFSVLFLIGDLCAILQNMSDD